MNKVHFGDWKDELNNYDDESFNLIYTDPPYGMNYKSQIPGDKAWNPKGKKSNYKFEEIIMGDKDGIDWESFSKEMYRVLKNDSFLFLHCNMVNVIKDVHWMEDVGFKYKGTVVWNKRGSRGGSLFTSMKRDWEPILYFIKGSPTFNEIKVSRKGEIVDRKRISEISDWDFELSEFADWDFGGVSGNERCGFPTQKPIELCKQVIRLCTNEGDVVCDPFMGSGSIAKASRELNREFVTVEKDEKIYNKFSSRALGNNQ